MHQAPRILTLSVLLASAVTAQALNVPGFSAQNLRIGLDPIENLSPAAADLSLASLALRGNELVLRIGTRAPWEGEISLLVESPQLRLRLVGTSQLLLENWQAGQWKQADSVRAHLERAAGAAVFEVAIPEKWQSELQDAFVGNSLVIQTLDAAGKLVDQLDQGMRDGSRTDHHVAFVHHGNQGLTWTDVLWGDEADAHEQHWADYLDTGSLHNGFDEVLGLHDLLDVPGNFHVSGTLQSAAAWYYPDGAVEGWNEWLARGVTEGWAAMLTSAYAQHIMPFVQDSMNDWSVSVHASMTEWRYGYTPHVAWVPERVWVSPTDNDGNPWDTSAHVVDWIGDDWLPHGVWGVLLDQEEHCDYQNNWANDRHIYTISIPEQGDLQILPINGPFTGACHHDAGDAWNQIISSSADELLIYGTDWEVVAEVAGFADQFPNALNNMIWLVQQIAGASGSVQSMKLDEALGGFSGGAINLQNGTYGLLGGRGGYGSDWLSPGTHNSWYGHWASTPGVSDQHSPQWDNGSIWYNTWSHLMAGPDNGLSGLAWTVMMTNLYETGWHDGTEISGWINRYSGHIKNARVYSEAARWSDGTAFTGVGAEFNDIDADGVDEVVLWNEKLMAVFESIGGRAPWIFARDTTGAVSVVGSCNTYWVDTEGDYNDGASNNHVAAFSDVSPNTEHDLYTMSIDTVAADFARVSFSHAGGLQKSMTLAEDNAWMQVDYNAPGEVYVKHGFTPDYMDLLYNAETERLWDPDAIWPQSAWMGQRNNTSGWTGALVLGNGGALHSGDFQGTLVRGDELRGSGQFRYIFYAGPAAAPDAAGYVSQLETLSQLDLDVAAPRMATTAPFMAPDFAVLDFSEPVDEASASNAANYSLSGFPPSVSIVSAQRDTWWNRVLLRLSGLNAGDSGVIHVSGVTDLAGNEVDAAYAEAAFQMPNGLTPHTILVDGTADFNAQTEAMNTGTDSLFITWDADYLYIGHTGTALNTGGDLFVYLDTDLLAGSGAALSAWGRVNFASAHRPEYELSIEGGGNSMQINSWAGSWNYVQYGAHGGSTYEGWTGNLLTEIKVPWSDLGNPEQVAISASVSQEDTQTTTLVWPESNPTGASITLSDWYIFAQPELPGPMPAMGVMPNNLGGAGLQAVSDLQLVHLGNGSLQLSWSAVSGAASYAVYQLDAPYSQASGTLVSELAGTSLLLSVSGDSGFYRVVARDF